MFAWQSAGKLRPYRMVWLSFNYNEPKFELIKWRRPRLRRSSMLPCFYVSKVEEDRFTRQRYPGQSRSIPRKMKAKRKHA